MKQYYPLFADVDGRSCVVIGGGLIAQRKATALLRCGARITVISPTVTRRLQRDAQRGALRHLPRRFRPADLRGAWLVYAATNDQRVNELVYQTATRQRIFTNVVDQKPLCSFIAPAIFRRGRLTMAISTGGASPTVAKRLKRELDSTIGSSYSQMLRLLAGLRGIAKRRLPSYQDRKRYFDALLDSPAFRLVREGRMAEARRHALQLLNAQAHGNGHGAGRS